MVAYIARGIGSLPFAPDQFRTLWASYAVGAGGDLIEKKNFESAYRLLRSVESYQINDVWVASAQYQLAKLYKDGKGIDTNKERARSLIETAASAGNQDAITYIQRQSAMKRRRKR